MNRRRFVSKVISISLSSSLLTLLAGQALAASPQSDQPKQTSSQTAAVKTASNIDPITVSRITQAMFSNQKEELSQLAEQESGYHRAYALYRLSLLHFPQGDMSKVKSLLKQAETSIASDPQPEAEVLLAAIYSLMMGADSSLAMELSITTNTLLGKNAELAHTGARAKYLQGIMAYHTPPSYGGGHDKALALFNQAVQAFEANNRELDKNQRLWGEAEARAWLGKVLLQTGDNEKAEQQFEQALSLNNNPQWIAYFK